MKLKAGFYMDNDGVIWLVYPNNRRYFQTNYGRGLVVWFPQAPRDYKYFNNAKKTYMGL
jgi:hypothetical protein